MPETGDQFQGKLCTAKWRQGTSRNFATKSATALSTSGFLSKVTRHRHAHPLGGYANLYVASAPDWRAEDAETMDSQLIPKHVGITTASIMVTCTRIARFLNTASPIMSKSRLACSSSLTSTSFRIRYDRSTFVAALGHAIICART